MPPKSKKASLWTTCSKCPATLATKEFENHSIECPSDPKLWDTPYTASNIIYTRLQMDNIEDMKNVESEMLDSLIFINRSLLQLCNYVIGEPVIIDPQDENMPSVVRFVWPIYSFTSSPFSTYLHANSMDPSWKGDRIKISIKKFKETPNEADTVNVICNDSEMMDNAEFRDFVRISQINKVISSNNLIKISFFGRNVILSIKSIAKSEYSIDIEDDKWFLICDSTKWVFYKENLEIESRSIQKDLIIGGVDNIVKDVESLLNNALSKSKNLANVNLTRCVLLYGASGVGKTIICKHIANKINVNIINISSTEIYSKYFGETEGTLKRHFNEALNNSPSVIIIDDIDTLCSKKSSGSTEQEQRVLSTIATLLENIHHTNKEVFILATTNKLDSIDPILRRYGRIDYEVEVPVPNKDGRLDIMTKLFNTFPHSLSEEDIKKLSESTHGFVGADISNLNTQAMMCAMKARGLDDDLKLNLDDFEEALKQVKPSAMREVMIEIPNVKWTDIGGQNDLKLKLKQAVEWPLKHGDSFNRLGIKPPSGLLMYGPPGCSKTMIAKALANESGLNFLSIKGPELFSKWVGESERAVREVFRKARQLAPSIIFFDEIDAISGERSKYGGGSNVQERVLAQILTEMDGISPLGNVTIVAATNRPDKIDSALLRPGRLDRIVYVPLPDDETRQSIFEIKFKKMPIDSSVCLDELIQLTKNYSGAEVQAVCHEAAMKALEDDIECEKVSNDNFYSALKIVQPRTPHNLLELYDEFEKSFL